MTTISSKTPELLGTRMRFISKPFKIISYFTLYVLLSQKSIKVLGYTCLKIVLGQQRLIHFRGMFLPSCYFAHTHKTATDCQCIYNKLQASRQKWMWFNQNALRCQMAMFSNWLIIIGRDGEYMLIKWHGPYKMQSEESIADETRSFSGHLFGHASVSSCSNCGVSYKPLAFNVDQTEFIIRIGNVSQVTTAG